MIETEIDEAFSKVGGSRDIRAIATARAEAIARAVATAFSETVVEV